MDAEEKISVTLSEPVAEIVRAGIQGLPKGQVECARSLGLPLYHKV